MDRKLIFKSRIKGPVFSILTPFNYDESIDFASLEKYIDYLYLSGARTFYVMAYNSRYSLLTLEEIRFLNQFVTEKVKSLDVSNIVIVGDPILCTTKASIEFAQHAEEVGADIISVIYGEKYYYRKEVTGLYEDVSRNSNIPILIHEMKLISGVNGSQINWPVDLMEEVAGIKNVVAVKEDSHEYDYTNEVLERIGNKITIILAGGGMEQWKSHQMYDVDAWLVGLGVLVPKLSIIFYDHYINQDRLKCEEIINNIEKPFFKHIIRKYGWHLAIKSSLEHFGLMSRIDRKPLGYLDDAVHEKIGIELNNIGLMNYK